MATCVQHTVPRASDAELRTFVEEACLQRGGPKRPLRKLIRRRYDYHSSFSIELLEAEFTEGTRLPLIFKDLSPNALLDGAREVRPHDLYRPDREIVVYRDFLDAAGLGTAICYGDRIDQQAEQYWLLLEKVAGVELYTIGDFSIWCGVARWLARAHSHLGESSSLQSSKPLLRYDREYFIGSIERARAQVSNRPSNPDHETTASAKQLWRTCERVASSISDYPQTLVHGEFYPSNILVSARHDELRICPVDWETAGIGTGLLDLAAIISGKWTESERKQLARSYFDALAEHQPWHGFEEFAQALLGCQLLVSVGWLGWPVEWEPPEMHRYDWLSDALTTSSQLQY